jgi:Zn-dependent peptidase ImmA (M78 family)
MPVVVVNELFPADRKRLTALHELGHLLLKCEDSFTTKEIEKLCHRFAGALLLPKDVFIKEFGGKRDKITVNELCDLKKHYGISIAAIMARAKNLGLVTDQFYIRFNMQLNARHWRQTEPVEYTGTERSGRFEQLLYRATAEDVISLTKAASLAGKPLAAFRDSLQFVS